MKVVVTGASGFIGSALAFYLRKNLKTSIGVSRKSGPNVDQVLSSYDETPDGDVIIHLAEHNDVTFVESLGEKYFEQVQSTVEKLQKKCDHLIYASSAAVFSNDSLLPHKPEDAPTSSTIYARAKRIGEKFAVASGGSVVRFSNIYGPGVSEKAVISDVLKQVPGTGPLKVRDASAVRDFLWIQDAVYGVSKVLLNSQRGIFHIASGRGYTVEEIAKTALKVANQTLRPVETEKKFSAMNCIVLDITSTKTCLDWSPKIDLESGLKVMIS